MKYAEQKELVSNLRALADFYEKPRSIILPVPDIYIHEYPAVWGMVKKIDAEGNETEEYGIKVHESLNKMKRIAKALGSCEKNWSGDQFTLKKRFGKYVTLFYSVSREAVCRKVPTGEVREIPAYTAPARTEEVYEYICEEVSLLA